MINYENRFLLAMTATIANALFPFYSSIKDKLNCLKLGPFQEAAFYCAKNALSTTGNLIFPVTYTTHFLSTGTGHIVIGIVLEHKVNGSHCPLAFFIEKVLKAESGYSTFNCERLAVHLAFHPFRRFMESVPQEWASFTNLSGALPTFMSRLKVLYPHHYLFIILDRHTRCQESIPMETEIFALCISAFIS
ncbi:uncharacterized protein [Palaemon carinicauda]|uniref:uncharacterized protein n=1 Tax=Palaemon carinicauda TaxID=392227 RepID=UPI0035B66EED